MFTKFVYGPVNVTVSLSISSISMLTFPIVIVQMTNICLLTWIEVWLQDTSMAPAAL